MHRRVIFSLAAALIGGWTAAQEEKACDLRKTEPRDYCAGCRVWPASDQIDKGACKTCKSRVEKVETCVKVYWDCPTAHDGKPKRHAKNCGVSPTCCKERPSLARVGFACESCKAKALKEADLRHAGDKCAGPIKKLCGESTRFPHGGVEE